MFFPSIQYYISLLFQILCLRNVIKHGQNVLLKGPTYGVITYCVKYPKELVNLKFNLQIIKIILRNQVLLGELKTTGVWAHQILMCIDLLLPDGTLKILYLSLI